MAKLDQRKLMEVAIEVMRQSVLDSGLIRRVGQGPATRYEVMRP